MRQIEKRLFNIKETAHYLGRTSSAIRHMVWRGEIPYVRLGKRVFFDILDLEQWIASHKVSETF